MGLFSRKPKTTDPVAPPPANAAKPPAATPPSGGSPDLWKALRDARDFVAPRPDITTHDLALVDSPGGKLTMTAFPDGAGRTLQDMRAALLKASGGAGGVLASYLPEAGGDVWMRVKGAQATLAFRAPGGPAQPLRTEDPSLRELAPAVACKNASGYLGGLYKPDPKRFEALLKEAEAAWPGYPPAQTLRAMALKGSGDAAGALRVLDQLRKSRPSAQVHYMAADTLDDLGRPAEALAAYDAAVKADPSFAGAWRDRGVLLSKMGRPDDALASYGQAISLDNGDPLARSNAAVLCFNRKRMGDVFLHVAAMDADRMPPGSRPREVAVNLLGELSQLALANQDWEVARTTLHMWESLGDLNPQATHALGVCHLKLGSEQEAVTAFRKALAKDPSYERPRQMLKELGVKP